MAGGYAHLTLVNCVNVRDRRLSVMTPEAAAAAGMYPQYVELGAVSPDYPYLAFASVSGALSSGHAGWADAMHHERAGAMLRAGIRRLRAITDPDKRSKCLAWLLGYAAHVGTDLTIHPMVNMRVGPYEQNKEAHRVCEMSQDVHIYQTRLGLGHVLRTQHLRDGIARCGPPGREEDLDPNVKALWEAMLADVHPQRFRDSPPKLDAWHKGFVTAVKDVAANGDFLFEFARHLLASRGVTYPPVADRQYIDSLPTPLGNQPYDTIFKRAEEKVLWLWGVIAREEEEAIDPDWNLDTGKGGNGDGYVFWS